MPSGVEKIANLHAGVNLLDDASALAPGQTQECLGFDLTIGGRLESAKGEGPHDLGSAVPDAKIDWLEILTMKGTEYVIITARDGLYVNGTKINTSFKGRFKAFTYNDQIYLSNGGSSLRFDGTNDYRWGIAGPSAMPVITIGANVTTTIDTFESVTNWIANATDCTCSLEASIKKEGSNSLKMIIGMSGNYEIDSTTFNGVGLNDLTASNTPTAAHTYYVRISLAAATDQFDWRRDDGAWTTAVAMTGLAQLLTDNVAVTFAATTGHTVGDEWIIVTVEIPTTGIITADSYVDAALDLSVLSDGTASGDNHLIQCWIYIVGMKNLEYIRFSFDLAGDNFKTDYYTCTIPFAGAKSGHYAPGRGSLAHILNATSDMPPGQSNVPPLSTKRQFSYGLFAPADVTQPDAVSQKKQIHTINYYNTTPTTYIEDSTWAKFSVPKSYFVRNGNGNYDWSDVKSRKIEVGTTGDGAATIYFDGWKLAGGSDLFGDYWFAYGWGRGDETSSIRAYSAPAKNADGSLIYSGPFHIECNPVQYGARTVSSDPQVNRCIFYILGGNLQDWWVYGVVNNNLTATGTFKYGEDDCSQKMLFLNNNPAPAGTSMVYWQGRCYMVGLSDTPDMVAMSEISTEGDFMLEAWPYANRQIVGFQGGRLLSIDLFNNQLVIRGDKGEWVCGLQDPTDLTTWYQTQVSDKPLLGQDAIVKMADAHIYPSPAGFVLSASGTNKIILPQSSPMITPAGMADARAVVIGLFGYFSFVYPGLGPVTAKFDFLTGAPRIALLNRYQYDCLATDVQAFSVYGVRDGHVYLLETSYDPGDSEFPLAVKSYGVMPGTQQGWDSVTFEADTSNRWLMARAYVDGKEVDRMPFRCDGREEVRFDFGPKVGYVFQVGIYGSIGLPLSDVAEPVKIYLPFRVRTYGNPV